MLCIYESIYARKLQEVMAPRIDHSIVVNEDAFDLAKTLKEESLTDQTIEQIIAEKYGPIYHKMYVDAEIRKDKIASARNALQLARSLIEK